MILECLEIEPEQPADGCIIWLHGLGAYGKEFAPIVPHMDLPTIRFVFPQSLDRPVTINGGVEMPSWYDIRTLEESLQREDQEDIAVSAQLIQNIIDDQVASGIPSWRIVLMGFSQGAAMALHVGVRYPQKILGIGVLSGYMLNPNLLALEQSDENRDTPILFCHGRGDLVVPYKKGRRAYEATKNLVRKRTWKGYYVGHELCIQEIGDIKEWFHHLFGGTA